MTPPARKFAERPLVIWTGLYASSQAGSIFESQGAPRILARAEAVPCVLYACGAVPSLLNSFSMCC